jgi:tetratricopeptide (TPR) repeat protein
MNSWHTFSPNGRWLAFSSKGRSLYTQLFLTHIDENGKDSPAILVENATAANRGVNIPEFVNIPPIGLTKMDAPATEFYRLSDAAGELARKGDYAEPPLNGPKPWNLTRPMARLAIILRMRSTNRTSSTKPSSSIASRSNCMTRMPRRTLACPSRARAGNLPESIAAAKQAPRAQSNLRLTEGNLATSLLETGQTDEALEHIRKALELDPDFADGHNVLGIILARMGKLDDAAAQLEKAVALTPNSTEYRFNLGRIPAARRSFAEAIPQFEKAVALTGGNEPQSLEMLAAMYAEVGHFSEAAQTARRALEIAARQNEVGLSEELRHRIAYYESQQDTSPARQ